MTATSTFDGTIDNNNDDGSGCTDYNNNSNYGENDDFDYIGTGGFLIYCGGDGDGSSNSSNSRRSDVCSKPQKVVNDDDDDDDGRNKNNDDNDIECNPSTKTSSTNHNTNILGVTREQTVLMVKNCPFFEKCLMMSIGNNDDDINDNSNNNNNNDDDSGRIVDNDDNNNNNNNNNNNDTTLMMTMREADCRIIHKPDWSITIARHMVEVLTKGKTPVPSLDTYRSLMEAADQTLVDVRLSNMVNYIDVCGPDYQQAKFLRLVQPCKYRFRLRANVTSRQWIRLLDEHNVLLYRKETNFVVQLYRPQNDNDNNDDDDHHLERRRDGHHQRRSDGGGRYRQSIHHHHNNRQNNGDSSRRNIDCCQRSEFIVHADRTIQSIFTIQRMLSGKDDDNEDDDDDYEDGNDPDTDDGGRRRRRHHDHHNHGRRRLASNNNNRNHATSRMDPSLEVFSVYFETTEPIPPDHYQLIERLAGGLQQQQQSGYGVGSGSNNNNNNNNGGGSRGVTRTCADAVEYQTEGYTVQVTSPDVLARALRPLVQNGNNVLHCSLRIDHPSPDTLGRFINACRGGGRRSGRCDESDGKSADVGPCLDYPSTLGMDAIANRYFCRKSIRDVLSILEYLTDYSTSAHVGRQMGGIVDDGDDFEIWELSSSSGDSEPF